MQHRQHSLQLSRLRISSDTCRISTDLVSAVSLLWYFRFISSKDSIRSRWALP